MATELTQNRARVILMRGDVVLIRALGGEALRRRVWEIRAGKVMILNPDYYEVAVQTPDEIRPIGFPAEDVFEFDLGLYEKLRASRNQRLWRQARKYLKSD